MKFAPIYTIDDVLPHIKDYPEFKVKTVDDKTVICYVMRDSQTFAGEGGDVRRECRGITFDSNGKIISRPLHKFFNVNETEETFEHNINWDDVVRVMNKMDGSMISCFLEDGKVKWKTKNSFNHDVIGEIEKLYTEDTPEYKFAYYMLTEGYTPSFEFTSLMNRIVLRYTEPKLTLLAIRHTTYGGYLGLDAITKINEHYNIAITEDYTTLFKEIGIDGLKEKLKSATNFEGYVFQLSNGDMFKWKCQWYNELHHMVSFTTERNVAEMSLSDTLDDYKSFLVETNSPEILTKVEAIESRVKNDIIEMEQLVEGIVALNEFNNPKDFSLKYKEHPLFTLLIAKFRGNAVKYIDFYKKRLEVNFSGTTL